VAHRLGDDTALETRPRSASIRSKHIDPFGTILLPGLLLLSHAPFLFGYAKPVPVNFRALNHPRIDMVWVRAGRSSESTSRWRRWRPPVSSDRLGARGLGGNGSPTISKTRWSQRRAGGVQHAAAAAAGRRTRRGRTAAQRAGVSAVAAGALRNADPDRDFDLLPMLGAQLGLNLDIFSQWVRASTGFVIRLLLLLTGMC